MAESSTSVNRRDGERGPTLNSPVVSVPRLTKEKDPPRYGAQHRQDALWEEAGGNEALPPQWWQDKTLDDRIYYQDPTLVLSSWNRPLPGVRLGDRFASGGEDMVICVWSKDGELLKEIKGHDREVTSLCWSKDGAHIFSTSYDCTLRKWRSIDGKELVVFQGHAGIDSLCISPDESHLVSAAVDYSVRIWDLKTNQPVGDPLLHDDEVCAVVISPDGKYIISGGSDAKIYVWSLEAALERTGHDHNADKSNAQPDAKLKGRPVRSRDAILYASQVSKQQPNNRLGGMTKYGKDFWDADTNTAPHPTASPSSKLRWRNLFDSLRFSTQSRDAPQSIPLEPRRQNSNLFPGGSSIPTIEVAAGRKKKRIYVSPPSAAEVARAEAAVAMQRPNGNEAGSSTQAAQPQAVPVTQASQGQPTETQGAGGGMGDVSYEVNCCAFFFNFGRRRPTSHQS
ncbi:WD40 repeat-like protein [Suillus weaverae]|nr:WD40 repeat-like protein [Suillus weaverae]